MAGSGGELVRKKGVLVDGVGGGEEVEIGPIGSAN